MKSLIVCCCVLISSAVFSQTDLKLLKNINPTGNGTVSFQEIEGYWAKVNNVLYFTADDGVHGRELWKTDGTAAGTKMLKDINPGIGDAMQPGITILGAGNFAYFSVQTGGTQSEIWRTDGTEAGTIPLLDFGDEEQGKYAGPFMACNNKMFFMVDDRGETNLWVSDGTVAGTQLLNNSGNVWIERTVNNIVYFTVYNSITDFELWRTDGTVAGTYILIDNIDYEHEGYASLAMSFNNKFYFIYKGDAWATDGTVSGTTLQKSFDDELGFYGYQYKVGDHQYFTRGTSTLWRTNGTDWTALKEFVCALPANFMTLNGEDYFLYYYGDCTENPHMQELWKTDGTPEGTVLVKNAGTPTFTTKPMAIVDNKLYFEGHDAEHGDDLWVSDGTEAGTHFVKELGIGDVRIDLTRFTQTTSGTYFLANDANENRQLWKLTGGDCHARQITFGTQQIGEITQINNLLIMSAITEEHGELELYYINLADDPTSDCVVTSVEDWIKIEVSLYPNPSDQKIISIKSDYSFDFIISNVQGKTILTGFKDKTDATVDLKNYPAGSYILTAFTSKGRVHKKLILK